MYFGGRAIHSLDDANNFEADVAQCYDLMIASFRAIPHLPLEVFLLPAGSDYLQSTMLLGATTEVTEDADRTGLWETDHKKKFRESGIPRPTPKDLHAFVSGFTDPASAETFKRLPQREQEIAYFISESASQANVVEEHSGDLSQSIKRCRLHKNVVCLTGSAKPWLAKRKRLLTGREMFALQGMSRRDLVSGSHDALLHSFGGNGFSGQCVMLAIASVLAPPPP